MEEKDNNQITQSETAKEGEFDPVQALSELKQNSVSKDQYNKVIAERDRYAKALFNGTTENVTKKEPADINALRKDLFSKDLSNLEFTEKALALRDAILDEKGVDIFVGKGEKLAPTDEDYRAAQKVADGLQSCVDIADGDSEIFTRELMRITNDVGFGYGVDPRVKR